VLGVIIAMGVRAKLTGQLYWRRAAITAILVVIGLVAGLLPIGGDNSEQVITNTDVVFLVDTTYSMNGRDGRNGTRLEDIKRDIQAFTTALGGSRVGIVTFDTSPTIYLPLTATSSDITIATTTLSTASYYDARNDPKFGAALTMIKKYFEDSKKVDATRNRVLVVMTDGELTGKADNQAAVLAAAAAVRPTIDASLVIGYGTNAGSTMHVLDIDFDNGKLIDKGEDAKDVVDGKFTGLITKRDEPFLQAMAGALGGTYVAEQNITDSTAALIKTRQTGADHAKNSPENRAVQQNILHVPIALVILTWVFVMEVLLSKRVRGWVANWRRKT
jgi:uncharacterized protein YegL